MPDDRSSADPMMPTSADEKKHVRKMKMQQNTGG
jgi:hypothetical protein